MPGKKSPEGNGQASAQNLPLPPENSHQPLVSLPAHSHSRKDRRGPALCLGPRTTDFHVFKWAITEVTTQQERLN